MHPWVRFGRILTDGFNEWESHGRRKQPWFIQMQDGHPLVFAGLWDHWRGGESCTVVPITPTELIGRFRDRLPMILPPKDYELWLDVRSHDLDRRLALHVPFPPEEITAYPATPLVNNLANDSPACRTPAV